MLTCIECGATVDEHTPDWRAYVIELDETDEGASIVVYCPKCAAKEFGPLQPKP